MTEINTKSDFMLRIRIFDRNGVFVGFPQCDFEIRVSGGSGSGIFKASYSDGKSYNLLRHADNSVIVVCDKHGLFSGLIKAKIVLFIPDNKYPDGTMRLVQTVDTDGKLVDGQANGAFVEARCVLPIKSDELSEGGDIPSDHPNHPNYGFMTDEDVADGLAALFPEE